MSSTAIVEELAEVFERVERWPEEARRTLVAMINGTFRERTALPQPKGNLANLIGLLKQDGPPPTDEEVDQMLEEELMRKYGP